MRADLSRRISISLDMLPDKKTTRVIVSDNGKAHEDTVEACYDNAISLICEKRSNTNTDGVASQESGFSKNGVGCGTALKHMVGKVPCRAPCSMMLWRLAYYLPR